MKKYLSFRVLGMLSGDVVLLVASGTRVGSTVEMQHNPGVSCQADRTILPLILRRLPGILHVTALELHCCTANGITMTYSNQLFPRSSRSLDCRRDVAGGVEGLAPRSFHPQEGCFAETTDALSTHKNTSAVISVSMIGTSLPP